MRKTFCLLAILVLFGGCASVTGYRLPNNDTKSLGNIYVVHFSSDQRHLEKIIADNLISRGYHTTFGEEQNISPDVNTIVTYEDHWQWDMANYMIRLKIVFKNNPDKAWIASAESYRPSLQRRSPEQMIQETLDKILK